MIHHSDDGKERFLKPETFTDLEKARTIPQEDTLDITQSKLQEIVTIQEQEFSFKEGLPIDYQFNSQINKSNYNGFNLGNAVRLPIHPGKDTTPVIIPVEGYRYDEHPRNESDFPMLSASVSHEKQWDLLCRLVEHFNAPLIFALESSHGEGGEEKIYLKNTAEKNEVLRIMKEHKELFLHDGCTGIRLIDSTQKIELSYDEHKIFFLYGENLESLEQEIINTGSGIPKRPRMKFIDQGDHIHASNDECRVEFYEIVEEHQLKLYS